jgi:hypothetical protein
MGWGAGRVPVSPTLAEAIAAVRRGRSYERYRKSVSKSLQSSSDEGPDKSDEEEGKSRNVVDRRQRRGRLSSSDSSSSSSFPPRTSRYLRNKRKSLEAKSLSSSPPAQKADQDRNQVPRGGRRRSTPSSSSSPKEERKSRHRDGVQPNRIEARNNGTHSPNATNTQTLTNTSPKLAEPSTRPTKTESHNRAAFFPSERSLSPAAQKIKPRKSEEKHTATPPRLLEPTLGGSPPPFGLYETHSRSPLARSSGSARTRTQFLPSPPSPEPSPTSPSAHRGGSGQKLFGWGTRERMNSGGSMDEVIAAADYGRFCVYTCFDYLVCVCVCVHM